MSAEPITYTSEQAYRLFCAGAIIRIAGGSAAVIVNGRTRSVTDPFSITTWIGMDADIGEAVRLPTLRGVPFTNGRWQHVNYAPKNMQQGALL